MKRPNQSSERAKRPERLEAEDRAVAYLEQFPLYVAFATALMAEIFLANKWSAEQDNMMRQGDTREVFQITPDDFKTMRQARDLVPTDVKVDLVAMHTVIALLSGFPSDVMWKAASTVAWRCAVRALLDPQQNFHDLQFIRTALQDK